MKKTILPPLFVIKTENYTPIMNSNDNHQFYSTTNHNDVDVTSNIYPDQLPVNFLYFKRMNVLVQDSIFVI
jgi:hypothetical protein